MRWYWFVLGVGSLLLMGATYRIVENWRFRVVCDDLSRRIAQSRFREARADLTQLLSRYPQDGEVLYQLGVCEWELGRRDAALDDWSRVPDSSAFAGRAAVQRARWELKHHRFAPAEVLMSKALSDSGPHAVEALETLVNLDKIEGRFDEARRLVRGFGARYPKRIGLLRELAQLGSINPHKLDMVRASLEVAAKAAPDDDRVWLGQANLATRVGRFDEAKAWIERCLEKRPHDASVWRASLSLALARNDTDAAWNALDHLKNAEAESGEALQLYAWFAAQGHNERLERESLSRLLDLEPSNLKALERLAELEFRAGRSDVAAKLRERKAALDRAKALYEILVFRPNASSLVLQLARLADTLSRPLEARILWGMVVEQQPSSAEAKAALARTQKEAEPRQVGAGALAVLLRDREKLSAGKALPNPGHAPAIATPVFVDDAESAGLRFTFDSGIEPFHHLPETMSGGVGLLDYDGDGWLDVYCVQGGAFLESSEKRPGGDQLFHNRGDGTFEDVTERSGIASLSRGYGHGVAVGDFDNDGQPDLFVTRWRSYALYRNTGRGCFEEVTEQAGLSGDRDWPTSAAFADFDGDGDLDLFVCHYLEWDVEHPKLCWDDKKNAHVFCGPPRFPSRPDHLFRNDGGRFVDVTAEAGIVDTHGQGLGVVACDYDDDGRVDIYVANDQTASFLYHNRGNMRFEEIGELSGVASSAEGTYQASMGVACGDPDGDGLPDLAVTNFYNEGTTLYHNLGKGVFSDHSSSVGLLVATRYLLGFGASFLDFDADGRLDLATTNGHVDDFRPREPYMMPAQLLAGVPGGNFVDVSSRAGPPWQVPRLGRGLAIGDLDNDGRIDLLILGQNQPLAYFHNKTDGGHWLALKLEGTVSNRDATGARVTITSGGKRQTAWRFGGGSYQSASDTRLHFGLGKDRSVERVEVLWPNGQSELIAGPLPGDAGYLIRQSSGMVQPLKGYEPPLSGSKSPPARRRPRPEDTRRALRSGAEPTLKRVVR